MAPCPQCFFHVYAREWECLDTGYGISHTDTARLLFKVIYQLRIHQQCLQSPISPLLPDSCMKGGGMFQRWHSKMVTLATTCLSGLPRTSTKNKDKKDYLTWNLYNFSNQYHPNKFNRSFLKKDYTIPSTNSSSLPLSYERPFLTNCGNFTLE